MYFWYMHFPSKLIEDGVGAFSSLPGIGKKTALRLVLHLLQKDVKTTEDFSSKILKLRQEIKHCTICKNVSDYDICTICEKPTRNNGIICIVENFRDIISIENTGYFNGRYHVLDGLISPINGVGPDQLNIQKLLNRIQAENITEVIMALNPTIDGDTTIFYLSKILEKYNVKITTIARGISFGGELEYVDEITLAKSIQSRLPYENYLSK